MNDTQDINALMKDYERWQEEQRLKIILTEKNTIDPYILNNPQANDRAGVRFFVFWCLFFSVKLFVHVFFVLKLWKKSKMVLFWKRREGSTRFNWDRNDVITVTIWFLTFVGLNIVFVHLDC